jgi:hypothetical protein
MPILAFLFGFVLDILIAIYTFKIMGRKPKMAGFLSGLITFINLFIYNLVIKENLLFSCGLPFVGGCVLGTYIATKYVR